MRDPEELVSIEASSSLRELGPAAAAARSAIATLLGSPDDSVRARAADVLARMGPAGEAPALLRALKDPSKNVRSAAAKALLEQPSVESATLAAVAALLSDAEDSVRGEVASETVGVEGFPLNPYDGQELWVNGRKYEWDADDAEWERD